MFLYIIIKTLGNIVAVFQNRKKNLQKDNYKYSQYFSGNISEYGEHVETTLRQYCSNIKFYTGNIAAVLLNRGGNMQKNVVLYLTFLSCY